MKRSNWAVASLVLGILSFVHILGIEKAAAAIAFGILAVQEINKTKGLHGKWIAVTGIILGIISITLTLLFLPLILSYLSAYVVS